MIDTRIRMAGVAAIVLVAFSPAAHAADVPFISGGVGADERQDLLTKEKDYTLKVVVAADNGDFLADVKVAIESSKQERVLDTTMAGPILLAKLPPGTYTVTATSDEKTQTRTVTIAAAGLRRLDFRWPASSRPPAAR